MTKKSPKGYPQCSKCGRVDITGGSSGKSKRSRKSSTSNTAQNIPNARDAMGGQVLRLMEIKKSDPEEGLRLERLYFKNRRKKNASN